MSSHFPPTCSQPIVNQVHDGASPTYIITLNGSLVEVVMLDGQPVQLSYVQGVGYSFTLPPVHANHSLVIPYSLPP
jgi:hypothetical protein